jgi:MFS family permease
MERQRAISETDGSLKQGEQTPRKLQRLVAAISLLALVIDSLTVRSLIVLAPFIRSGIGIDESQYGYIMGALMMGTLLTTLPIGSILGRLNTGWAFGVILTVIGVALLVVAFQNSYYGLMGTLFIIGVLRAGIIPLTNRVIAENFDRSQRGA